VMPLGFPRVYDDCLVGSVTRFVLDQPACISKVDFA